jgi:type IV conjugative transfer system protein TraE
MNPRTNATLSADLTSSVSGLKMVIAGLFLIILVLLGAVLFAIYNQKTIIQPNGEGKPYVIGSSYGNKEYLQDLSFDVLALWGNTNPGNINYIEDRLLKFVDSDGHKDLKAKFVEAKDRVRKQQVSTLWEPREMEVDQENKRVVTSGFLHTYLAKTHTSTEPKKFEVTFRITQQGKAYVRTLRELEAKSETKTAL